MVIYFHLSREVFFQPFVLLHVVLKEPHGLFAFYLHRRFSFVTVVEPCLRPPAYAEAVWIDGDDSRDVETLDVDVQFRQRVDGSFVGYCFATEFFFKPSPAVVRNISCLSAR